MSEIINNNDSYIVRTNGRIYVKLGGRYIALIDEDGNLNVKLKTSISTVSNFNDINSEGLYYYNGNIYAYANGSPYLLTGGGGSGDVINQVLSGDLRAVTSNAVYVTTENIKNNLANKVLPFEEFKTISSVVYNPTDITEGRVLYSLNLKCFILENTVGGRTTYYTNWKGSEKYQTINSENVSQITLKPDVLYLFTNLSAGQASARTLYMAKSSGDLTQVLTDRDLNDVLTLDDIDTEITSSSSKPVSASAIYAALSKLGSIEYFDGVLSAEETLDIIDSATTSNDILILYSYKYKTFVAKYNNNYYKRWNTADKFFDGTTPNKHILFVCDDTLYFWNNDLVTVNVDNINDCIIYVDLYMKGGQLPTPSASDLGKYAIVESNTYQLYRAEQFNNVISYTAKVFSKNRLYINDNKLYLWNGSELVQVGISEFNLLIAPFDGVINSATIQESSYTGTGDVFYITSLQRFAFRVISLNQTKYYDNWSDSGLYFGEDRKPRKDTIYVNNGVGYVFDGTNGLIAIGGSTPSGPDSQQTVDQSLSTTSTNAIANKTVTTELNNLSGRVTTMEQSGVPSEVTADEVTISAKNASGGNAAIHLASNPKSIVNSVGAIHVTDSVLPSNVSQNTKYIIYKDITTGNVDGLNYIQLAPGTKIVPNGGIPKVPVVGGEMSWVHSSDIGMIQDDGSHNTTIGAKNFEIFKEFIGTKYNLILDGEYYMHTSSYSNTDGSPSEDVILINRPLCIQGGTLNLLNEFISIVDGGSFRAENTTFVKVEASTGYPVICINPTNSLIERIEFINCTFVNKSTRYTQTQIAFIGGYIPANVAPMDATRKWSPAYFNEVSQGKPSLATLDSSTKMDIYWIFPDDYIVDKTNQTVKYINEGEEVSVSPAYWDNHAVSKNRETAVVYEEDASGDTLFVINSKASHSIVDHKVGYYRLKSLATEYEIENSDGKLYSAVTGTDEGYVTVEHCGVKIFKFVNCYFDGTKVACNNQEISEVCEFLNCTFTKITASAISIASDNKRLYANDWLQKSCTCHVLNCVFTGWDKVIEGTSTGVYATPILIEMDRLVVRNCRMENIVSTNTTYEVYGNLNELIFENNYVYNVTNAIHKVSGNNYYSLSEFFKSKGARYTNKLPTRIIRNNWYELDRETLWPMFKNYMEKTYSDDPLGPEGVFNKYAMNTSMMHYVTHFAVFSKIVLEGNTFKSDGALSLGSMSGRAGNMLNVQIVNNTFDFESYISNFSKPLIALKGFKPTISNVNIIGNTFSAKENSVITLISDDDSSVYPDNVKVLNNIFNNCSFSFYNYVGGTGLEPFTVGNIIIKNNILNSPDGLASVFSHKADVGLKGGLYLAGDNQRYNVLGKADIDYIDFQDGGTVAPTAKIIDAVESEGIINVKIPHMCRTLALREDGFSDGKATGNNRTLVFKWSLFGNESYGIEIKYTYKNVRYTKYMEILHAFPVGPSHVFAAFTVRDVNGLIYRNTAVNDAGFTISNLSTLDDIGLQFFVEAIGQRRAVTDYTTKEGSIYLHIYTMYPDGSRNDAGTDIEIKTYKIPNSLLLPMYCNATWNIGTPTSINKFIPSGSTVTQQWVDTISAGYSYTYSASSSIQETITVPYLVAADTGYNVYIDGRKYTWNGTSWNSEKNIVSLTQAEYDAITNKDANTLYLIIDSQS